MQSRKWIWAELPNYKEKITFGPLTANAAGKTCSAHSAACITEQGRSECPCHWWRWQESMRNSSLIPAQTVIENLTVNSEDSILFKIMCNRWMWKRYRRKTGERKEDFGAKYTDRVSECIHSISFHVQMTRSCDRKAVASKRNTYTFSEQ